MQFSEMFLILITVYTYHTNKVNLNGECIKYIWMEVSQLSINTQFETKQKHLKNSKHTSCETSFICNKIEPLELHRLSIGLMFFFFYISMIFDERFPNRCYYICKQDQYHGQDQYAFFSSFINIFNDFLFRRNSINTNWLTNEWILFVCTINI